MKTAVAITALLVFVVSLSAAKDKEKKSSSDDATLNFTVLRAATGKPVRNAAVILHQVSGNGHQSRGGFELKTNADGKTSFDGVPYGKLRVQVLATGYQTFGQDYDVNQPVHE